MEDISGLDVLEGWISIPIEFIDKYQSGKGK